MKSYLKIVMYSILSCFILVLLSACAKTDTLNTDVENSIEKAKQDVLTLGDDTENRIEEAIQYIEQHAQDPFADHETTKQMAYYGAYLDHLSSQDEQASQHEIAKLGRNVHTLIHNVTKGDEDITSDVSNGLKKAIRDGLDRMNQTKEEAINEFKTMVHRIGEENDENK